MDLPDLDALFSLRATDCENHSYYEMSASQRASGSHRYGKGAFCLLSRGNRRLVPTADTMFVDNILPTLPDIIFQEG